MSYNQNVDISSSDYINMLTPGLSFRNIIDQNDQSIPNPSDGIIFEFVPCDISASLLVTPLLEAATEMGFTDVSGVAIIDVLPSSLDKLFYFYSTDFSGIDFTSNESTDIISKFADVYYGINIDYSFNVNYSNSFVQNGKIMGNGTNKISDDYVRHLANSLFGVTNLVSVFSNENLLVNGVAAMDISFNNTLNKNIRDMNVQTVTSKKIQNVDLSWVFLDISSNVPDNKYVKSCRQLIDGFLSIAETPRGNIFFQDLSSQSMSKNTHLQTGLGPWADSLFWVKFHDNDMLSLKLTYRINTVDNYINLDEFRLHTVTDRSYKVVLRCKTPA